jgi:hypothetical protein
VIVRILGEGQYNVDDEHLDQIEELEGQLDAAIQSNDEDAFAGLLESVINAVRENGTPVGAETIAPSTLTIPHEGATIAEVRELLAEETAGADKGDGAGAGIVAEEGDN